MNYLKGSICVFGDSITWGWGATEPRTEGWTNKLLSDVHKPLSEENRVYSLGIPGETTSGLLKRIENESYARSPNTIIIASGLNDCRSTKLTNVKVVELEEFKKNIFEIIQIAKKFTNKIVFVGLTRVNENLTIPLIWNNDEMFRNEDVKQYNDELKKICSKEKIKFINVIDLLSNEDLDATDGIHPNFKGHEKIFKYIKQELEV